MAKSTQYKSLKEQLKAKEDREQFYDFLVIHMEYDVEEMKQNTQEFFDSYLNRTECTSFKQIEKRHEELLDYKSLIAIYTQLRKLFGWKPYDYNKEDKSTEEIYYRDTQLYNDYGALLDIEDQALQEFYALVSLGYRKYDFGSHFRYGAYSSNSISKVLCALTFPISIIYIIIKNKEYRKYQTTIKALIAEAKNKNIL